MSALYEDAKKRFTAVFGDGDIEIVRAPGRVNLIGEHTDYNGLPVLPMALDREIAIALAANSQPEIELTNVIDTYPAVKFDLGSSIEPYNTGHWGNYAKAAAQVIWGWAAANSPESLPLKGYRGCVAGSVPSGSGLSSSSALVVASALGLAHVNNLPIPGPDLADLLAKGERYVGTEGGGMDQAASILSQKGFALKIDFFPLRITPVKVPAGCSIVVANSLVVADKTGGALQAYNTRVAECRLGLSLLKDMVAESCPEAQSAVLLKDFSEKAPQWPDLIDNLPDNVDGLKPRMRVRHVLTEGHRVELAASAMQRNDAAELGDLMNKSHESCANDYEISCPELDELVETMRDAGALGARLTGAGFGGCTVSLVATADVDMVLNRVWESYYAKREIESRRRDEVLFACSPAPGAGVVR
jgi:N-acetylgalactosamine kinase